MRLPRRSPAVSWSPTGDRRPVDKIRLVTLPIVDSRDIRFRRMTTAEGLSQTRVRQIVQDDRTGSTVASSPCLFTSAMIPIASAALK